MLLPQFAGSIRRSIGGNFYVQLIVAYFLLWQYCRFNFYADPTSYFFKPGQAFQPGYSAQRQEDASTFLSNSSKFPFKRDLSLDPPKICVGIATVAREGVNYLPSLVGSLLDGLTREERQQIELKVFFAHPDPAKHPDWKSSWVKEVVDERLEYTEEYGIRSMIRKIEGKVENESEKSLFDYGYLLQICERSGAAYTVMIEDDNVAAKGWFRRTMEAIESVNIAMVMKGRKANSFFYLRLFYTEKFLGWNSESNSTYVVFSALFIVAPLLLFCIRPSSRPRSLRRPTAVIFLSLIYAPLLVGLFFLAGRPSVLPTPRGVNVMSHHACCTQAMVFPKAQIQGLAKFLDREREANQEREEKEDNFQDYLIEEYANAEPQTRLRWALTPSVVQHVGKKSSKVKANGGWSTEDRQDPRDRLWSHAFEKEGAKLKWQEKTIARFDKAKKGKKEKN